MEIVIFSSYFVQKGKLEAEFSLLTAEEALLNAVGKAREAPQPLDEPKFVLKFT